MNAKSDSPPIKAGRNHSKAPWAFFPLWLVTFSLGFVLAGCVHPIGATRVSPRESNQQVEACALNSSECSSETRLVLHRYALEVAFEKSPAATLKTLHKQACSDERRELLFALAELNYQYGDQLSRSLEPDNVSQSRDWFLASAIYAYLYLFADGHQPPPGPYDRRFRTACDFYNRALGRGLIGNDGRISIVELGAASRTLPEGNVALRFTRPAFKWDLDKLDWFELADAFKVRGLTVRDRQSGLGAPVIGVGKTLDQRRFPRRIPATLFLRVNGDTRTWTAGQMNASLELYSSYDTNSVQVAGDTVPLEADLTAPLAYALNDSSLWRLGAAQFFSSEEKIKSDIYLTQPYTPDSVPVVFVHGTFSSPIWWAEMWNTLRADPQLRTHCQFWNFIYNSGNPISYSAANLREELQRKVQQLDPEGKDAALRKMVIIGHSQGGLLTKMTATDTGDKLWRALCDKNLDELKVKPEVREALRTNFFFDSLPCVKRVVFISTPHRGSYLAGQFVRRLARWFMKLPGKAVQTPAQLLAAGDHVKLPAGFRHSVPTSLDGMSPKNPLLLAMADLPVAPQIKAHSIIAIKGDDNPPLGGDGVVKYSSAHVPYVESELVVRSSHSCQAQAATIEEVRRILLEHLMDSGLISTTNSVVDGHPLQNHIAQDQN